MSNLTENSIFADAQPIAEQSETVQANSTRPNAMQRKSDLDDYRKAYFGLIKLGKDNKHRPLFRWTRLQRQQLRRAHHQRASR